MVHSNLTPGSEVPCFLRVWSCRLSWGDGVDTGVCLHRYSFETMISAHHAPQSPSLFAGAQFLLESQFSSISGSDKGCSLDAELTWMAITSLQPQRAPHTPRRGNIHSLLQRTYITFQWSHLQTWHSEFSYKPPNMIYFSVTAHCVVRNKALTLVLSTYFPLPILHLYCLLSPWLYTTVTVLHKKKAHILVLLYSDYHHFSFVAKSFCSSSRNIQGGITLLWECGECRNGALKMWYEGNEFANLCQLKNITLF